MRVNSHVGFLGEPGSVMIPAYPTPQGKFRKAPKVMASTKLKTLRISWKKSIGC